MEHEWGMLAEISGLRKAVGACFRRQKRLPSVRFFYKVSSDARGCPALLRRMARPSSMTDMA